MQSRNRPNLFVIGAMKSGSTTLHELLGAHPDICMSEPKEPCFFVDPDVLKEVWPEMWARGYWRSEEAYLALFSAKPTARYFGESSTDYSKRPEIDGVVNRIAAFSPEARLLYIMRDPVERTISHYWHMVEHRGETRAPIKAIRDDPRYTNVSNYAMQLEPYIRRFGRGRLYTLTFEALTGDPQATMRGVFDWLGVLTDFEQPSGVEAHNPTPAKVRRRRVGMAWLNAFRHSKVWGCMGPMIPARIRRLGVAMTESPIARRGVDMSQVTEYLRPLQRRQTDVLVDLLDREFPEWTSLYGD